MKRRTTVVASAAMLVTATVGVVAADATPPSDQIIHHWSGDQSGERYGWAVSELADIDGDGVQDAIIGAPFHTVDGQRNGHTDVRSGRTGEVLHRFEGAPGDHHGYAMADAGDVDRDGTHDIIVGAPGGQTACTGSETLPGRAYVYSGATGDLLRTLTGQAVGDHFGSAVAGAGDVTGDGHADLLVGAQCNDAAGQDAGRAYIYSGADGTLVRTFDAEDAGDEFGVGTAPVGDVTGDGITDQVVGAKDAGQREDGAAYVFSGADGSLVHTLKGDPTTVDLGWFFVAGAGDVDGDGVPDIYAGDFDAGANDSFRGRAFVFSGATGKKIHVFTGAQNGDGLGPGRGAGDVDGDGVPDIAIGSYTSSDGASFGGRIDVFSGADGSTLRTYMSSTDFQTLGFDVVGIGDVNGDGVPDLLASGAFLDDVFVLAG